MIFGFGILRDYLCVVPPHPEQGSDIFCKRYHQALAEQPKQAILPEPLEKIVPIALIGLGQLFVVSSTWALGITGTFLGDYFGILMDERVEGLVPSSF